MMTVQKITCLDGRSSISSIPFQGPSSPDRTHSRVPPTKIANGRGWYWRFQAKADTKTRRTRVVFAELRGGSTLRTRALATSLEVRHFTSSAWLLHVYEKRGTTKDAVNTRRPDRQDCCILSMARERGSRGQAEAGGWEMVATSFRSRDLIRGPAEGSCNPRSSR